MNPHPSLDGPEHVSTRRVVFVRPFTLGSDTEILPAGVYDVETTEQTLDISGLSARLRTSTVLIIPTRSGFRWRDVLASELEAALLQDATLVGDGEAGSDTE